MTELDALLHDAFIAVQRNGMILDKTAWLQRYRYGDLVHDRFHWSTVGIAQHRGLAFAVGRLEHKSSFRGNDASGDHTVTLAIDIARRGARLLGLHQGGDTRL